MAAQPQARVDPVRETFYGTTVEDPYRWMEDWQSDEARAWLEAQAAFTREYLSSLPERDALLRRVEELSATDPEVHAFQAAGGRIFYLRRDPDDSVAKLAMRVEPYTEERVLFDPNTLPAEEHSSIDWFFPSRDGSLVAFGLAPGGSENNELHLVSTESGEQLDTVISRVRRGHVSWLEDNRSFLYHRYADLPPGAPAREKWFDTRTYLHRIGADPEGDPVVFARGAHPGVEIDRQPFPIVRVSPGNDWMIGIVFRIHHITGPGGELRLYVAPKSDLEGDPSAIRWTQVTDFDDCVVDYAVSGDTLYVLTYLDAPRYRVLAVDLRDPDLKRARPAVPEGGAVIEAIRVAGDFLLLRELDAGIGRLSRVPLAGGEPERVPLPVEGSIIEWTSEPGSSDVVLVLTAWTVSPRAYRYHVGSGTLAETDWIPPSSIDFSSIEAHEELIPARDGAQVPLSLIHKRELALDGDNPTILIGYGSYGVNLSPVFIPAYLAWYERGGVLAVGHIRGGGEKGRDWHEAGRKLRKENTIADFIACAEWLIDKGFTRPGRLAGEGGSAGGIPTGGSLVRRPDLWAVMVMAVPMANSLRFEHTPGGPPNIPEFGSVTTEEGFRGLHMVDSYLRVQDGTAYPAVLLTTGLNDPRVEPWQAMKMAARLQAASTSGKPVLLRVELHGGHGIGAIRQQREQVLADTLAFMLQQLGVTAREPAGQSLAR